MSVSTPTHSATRPLVRFLRTPKGLLLVLFIGLLAVASLNVDVTVVMPNVIVAAITAAAIDMAVTYWRRGEWILPDGAVLTGMIVAFVLRPQESWLILVTTVAVAILSKHALRTHWSNILNPAAFALVFAAIVLHTGQSWWGALPDLGIIGALVLLAAGGFIADRINKLPMILAFFAAYFTLFTFAGFFNSAAVGETFRTPDLQAALFFAFFMLDDPPTSPVRHEDQIVFGMIVAVVAYFAFTQFGGVYYLPAGLLAGNLWESGRRLVLSRIRAWRTSVPQSEFIRNLRLVAGVATALVALLLLVIAVATSGRRPSATLAGGASVSQPGAATAGNAPASQPSATAAASVQPQVPPQESAQPNARYPFLASFNDDLAGTYSQTGDASASSLTVDATMTGDLTLKLHLELATTGGGDPNQSTVTLNKAQLLDVDSNAVVCEGQLTAFNNQVARASCDGSGPYQGVRMTFEPILSADSASTLSGSLSGTMQRTP
jgi:NQR2, RnfD, RnfE family